jgi:hypothetical protein
MAIDSAHSYSVNADTYRSNTTASNSGYVVLSGDRTASKSLLSKAKNLLYTLSTPFRALMRVELHRRVGQGEENSAAFKNIKSTPMPRSTTSEVKPGFASQPDRGYTIISTKEGYGKPSLLDRIWG